MLMSLHLTLLMACGEKDVDTGSDTTETEETEETEDTEATEETEETSTDENAVWDACNTGSEATEATLPASEAEAAQLTITPDLGDS